jgi:plasmid maintenance system antidote protein VapI
MAIRFEKAFGAQADTLMRTQAADSGTVSGKKRRGKVPSSALR